MPLTSAVAWSGKPQLGLHIELCVLPAYSPHLKLIKRLWKCGRTPCLSSHDYADFARFKTAIVTCLDQTHPPHKAALDSLVG